MNDKVTPITKNKLSTAVASMLPGMVGRPYEGPSQAIKELLDHHDFNQNVIDKDWIEVRIVAKFSATGAIVHTMQARQVQLSEREAPGIEFLKMLATVNKLPAEALFNIATVEEIEKLNTGFEGLSQDQLLAIAMEDETAGDLTPFDTAEVVTQIVDRFENLTSGDKA